MAYFDLADSLENWCPRYTRFDPAVPVWCPTQNLDGCLHRFFDTSPISPSGRYLAVTRFGDESRLPAPGETAEILLLDLASGEMTVLAETRGFGTQVGAHLQWGASDEELFFNDVEIENGSWRPFGICLNPLTGARRKLEGMVYMVTRDGRMAGSTCLLRTSLTQYGYGVLAPMDRIPLNAELAADDGLYVTDVSSGKQRLLASFAQIAAAVGREKMGLAEDFSGGAFYGFHVKWNPQGTRLMMVVRYRHNHPGNGQHSPQLITISADGEEIHVAIPHYEWCKGGHHPDWCPDGEHVMMNLKLDGETMRFVHARYDGSGLTTFSDDFVGSGHPTLHPDGKHIITDEYVGAKFAYEDQSVPLRWFDLERKTEREIIRISSRPAFAGTRRIFRVDPHPAWDRSYRYVSFNGCDNGSRRVYIADLRNLLN